MGEKNTSYPTIARVENKRIRLWLQRGNRDGLYYVTIVRKDKPYHEEYYRDDISHASVDRILVCYRNGYGFTLDY